MGLITKLLADWLSIGNYVLAGNATFTLRSTRTGVRYTYCVKKAKARNPHEKPPWFVSVLTGPENEASYSYMGVIDHRGFHETHNSRVTASAPSWRAFAWFFLALNQGDPMSLRHFQFWHSGKCGACGRTLTVPESIETGLGPECAARRAA
jgi:hypothetical protein